MRFRIDRLDKGISTTNVTVSDLDDLVQYTEDRDISGNITRSNSVYQTYSYSFNPIKIDGTTVKTPTEARVEVKGYFTDEATKKQKQTDFYNNIGSGLIGTIL